MKTITSIGITFVGMSFILLGLTLQFLTENNLTIVSICVGVVVTLLGVFIPGKKKEINFPFQKKSEI